MHLYYCFLEFTLLVIFLSLTLYYRKNIKSIFKIILLSSILLIFMLLTFFLKLSIPIYLGGIKINFHLLILPIIFIWIFYLVNFKFTKTNYIFPLVLSLLLILSEALTFIYFYLVCNISLTDLNDYSQIYYFTDYYCLFFMLAFIILVSFANVGFYFKNRINYFYIFLLSGNLGIIILTLASLIIYFIINYIYSYQHKFISYTLFMFTVIFMTFVCCLLLFILLYKLIKTQKEINELKHKQLNNVYNNIISSSFEDMMKIKHDIANILEVSKNYSSSLSNDLITKFKEMDKVKFCSNEILNQILVIKTKEAKNANIDVDVKINSSINEINLEDIDLVSLITNLFDNSIEASIMSNKKSITLQINIKEDIFFIHIRNFLPNKGMLHSKKYENKKFHGYGKKIISDIIYKYNGQKEEFKNDYEYIVDITIPNKRK